MSVNPCKHDGDHVLLVEGVDDCRVILELSKRLGISQHFGIYECGSVDEARKRLNALLASSQQPSIIGLVVDADADPAARWQGVKDKIAWQNYLLPEVPCSKGTIVEPQNLDQTRLGFWLMPDNKTPGTLEDFCMELAEANSINVATEAVDNAQAANVTRFREVHKSKAIIHTYLAWQETPGLKLGQAVTWHALESDKEIAKTFVKWLTRLFK